MSTRPGQHARFFSGFYPLSLDLNGRSVLVVGAGQLACSRIYSLIDSGATVEVVAPVVLPEIDDLVPVHGSRVRIHRRSFAEEDAARIKAREFFLVMACTNSEEENLRVGQAARSDGVLVHVVDNLDLSDFVVPKVVKRGHLKIAVSSDGLSPAVDRAVRARVESALGVQIDKYVLFLGFLRERLLALETDPRLAEPGSRRKAARRLAESEEIYLAVQRENFDEAARLVQQIVAEEQDAARV